MHWWASVVRRLRARRRQHGRLCREVAPLTAARDIVVPFASAQTQILLGQPGYRRTDPDHLALMVGNYILGGVVCLAPDRCGAREARPHVWRRQSLCARFARRGLHHRPANPPDQADAALHLVREMLAQFVQDGPTEAELQAAMTTWW